jgi:AcrR family transcriptional regulator
MGNDRDLNRTRERIMAAALTEFSARGLAGARTGAIARRAGVNQRMIFYCFKTKEGLYREVLRRKLAERASVVEANSNDDFAMILVKGYESACCNLDHVRMSEWEALVGGKRKLVAEHERRAVLAAQVAQLRRARERGELPAGCDEKMLTLVSVALRLMPLALPQITRLVSGLEAADPRFRRRWSKCLRWIGERIEEPGAPRRRRRQPVATGDDRNGLGHRSAISVPLSRDTIRAMGSVQRRPGSTPAI